MSPLGRSGGSQDIMIFVLDAGIALMACGAEGTAFRESNAIAQKKRETYICMCSI